MTRTSELANIDWTRAHQWPLRVYYEDTDAGGVVFYANYLKFMERARTEWLRSLGVQQQELAESLGLGFVVSQLDIKYLSAAKLDDSLIVQTTITQAGRASLHFAQRVIRLAQTLAEGHIRVGCVNLRTMRPTALPPEIHRQLVQSD